MNNLIEKGLRRNRPYEMSLAKKEFKDGRTKMLAMLLAENYRPELSGKKTTPVSEVLRGNIAFKKSLINIEKSVELMRESEENVVDMKKLFAKVIRRGKSKVAPKVVKGSVNSEVESKATASF